MRLSEQNGLKYKVHDGLTERVKYRMVLQRLWVHADIKRRVLDGVI